MFTHLKTVSGVTRSGVRIPLPPPDTKKRISEIEFRVGTQARMREQLGNPAGN